MAEKSYVVPDCGCQIVLPSSMGWTEPKEGAIIYCPMHKAAPALLAALDKLTKITTGADARITAYAALKKARSQGTEA